jgi:hypothetical protein
LHVVAVKGRLLAHRVVGVVVENGRAGFDPLAVARGVNDVVGGPAELVNRLVKQVRLLVGHVDLDRDGAADLHTRHNLIHG